MTLTGLLSMYSTVEDVIMLLVCARNTQIENLNSYSYYTMMNSCMISKPLQANAAQCLTAICYHIFAYSSKLLIVLLLFGTM
jgi:hypothetical protein